MAANGASAKQDWFTRYSQYLLSNTLMCSVNSVTSGLAKQSGVPSAEQAGYLRRNIPASFELADLCC